MRGPVWSLLGGPFGSISLSHQLLAGLVSLLLDVLACLASGNVLPACPPLTLFLGALQLRPLFPGRPGLSPGCPPSHGGLPQDQGCAVHLEPALVPISSLAP